MYFQIGEQTSLVFDCVIKQKCGKGSYNDECKRTKEWMGTAWLKKWSGN
jgi:stalled ribosome alternative rescue factor ArfA